MSDDDLCLCGCGMTRRQAVQAAKRSMMLNEEQADAQFDAVQQAVRSLQDE